MCSVPFSANAVLSGLKDFQRRTVDYVFERFYGDDPTSRFLVADEVGLGKTLVAKGIIAKTLEHLQGKVDRIDVVYLCSNAAIASQNISRLNINGGYSLSTRLTYLPTQLTDLEKSKVNFVSLTPGTAFDQDRQRGGHVEERVIINLMLQDLPTSFTNKSRHFRNGLLNAMQGRLEYREKWREMAENSSKTPDKKLSKQFCQAVLRDQHLSDLLLDVSERFGRFRGNVPHEDNDIRYELIKNLRKKLSSVCISLLEPDLVILDEFQRFKHLLDENNEASNIARELFEYPNVRVLLISATPYKMFTLNHEQDEDDHYPDFIRTLKFLFNNNVHKVNEINNLLSVQRENIFSGSDVSPSIPDTTKVELERALLKVMCRTERVLTTQDRNAMLQENTQILPLEAEDICRAASLDSVAVSVGAGDQTEYWKSAPYLLNFLKDYELRNKLDNRLRNPSEEIRSALNTILSHSLSADSLTHYQALETSNPKMSALYEDTIDKGMWQLLWMPPSLPYMKPGKIYSGKESLTKELVFSSWKAVPNAIAAVLSYQAERKMVAVTHVRHNELYDRIGQLLQFSISRDGRLGGMPVVGWLYPSPTLATVIDPLKIAISQGRGPLSAEEMKEEVRVICRRLIETLPEPVRGGRPDERWYWVAPILLDRDKGVIDWCRREDGWLAVIPKNKKGSQDQDSHFKVHIDHLADMADGKINVGESLGPRPADLEDALCELALAGPGICALRALRRVAPDLDSSDPILLTASARISSGFRSLFNLPETIALLRGSGDGAYWRLTLKYGLDGNIQSVLDEYVHVLLDSLGLQDKNSYERIDKISESVLKALSLKTSKISIDSIVRVNHGFKVDSFPSRARFALRLEDIRGGDEDKDIDRVEDVQAAFNSPFRPFILASTSIGQEGLDFHTWCHSVTHWNLPSNPVDLEQREGRVHRYKGHAVRKNVADLYGLSSLPKDDKNSDPWRTLFQLATESKPAGLSDLVPFWIFEGKYHVERRVPLLPFSKDIKKFDRLKRALALYRMVFGQPRQEDLLSSLENQPEVGSAQRSELFISLRPPVATSSGDRDGNDSN